MENATKRIGMASGSTHWEKAGMTQEEWKKAVTSGCTLTPWLARRSVKIMPVSSVAIWEKTGDSSWGLCTSS